MSDLANNECDTQWKCTVCGRVGSVGRCCGLETRTPLNDAARYAQQEIERLHRIEAAARNLVAQKGRHNTQVAYERLVKVLEGEGK